MARLPFSENAKRVVLRFVKPWSLTLFFMVLSVFWFSIDETLMPEQKGLLGSRLLNILSGRELLYLIITSIVLYFSLKLNRRVLLKNREALKSSLEETVFSMIRMVESRDSYTAGHSERVARYSRAIGEKMGLPPEVLDRLWKTGLLHDIGKVETPDTILLKPDRLTNYERSIIEKHPLTGYNILSEISIYRDLAKIILHHHEWFNGKGYPYGLSGVEIPLESRILAVADTFDAMTTNRVYRTRLPVFRALELLHESAGTQFDPDICHTAISVFSRMEPEIDQRSTSVFLEAERMSYYFRDRETARYSQDFLHILANNTDSFVIEEAWILDSCGDGGENSVCETILQDLGNHPGVMVIQLDTGRICAIFPEIHPEFKNRLTNVKDFHKRAVIYDGSKFKREVLEQVVGKGQNSKER